MSHDSHRRLNLTGTAATNALKRRLSSQQAANQDETDLSQPDDVVTLGDSLSARRTLSEKKFMRKREKFRFAALSRILRECTGADVELLRPQEYFKKRALKRLADYLDVVRDGLVPPVIHVNNMLHPSMPIELRWDDAGGILKLFSLLGEGEVNDFIEGEDAPPVITLKGQGFQGVSLPEESLIVLVHAHGQESALDECDGILGGGGQFESGLGARDWEGDDGWLEDQNATMGDVQVWWIDDDEAELVALGRGVGEVVFVGQARVSTAVALAIN